MNVGTFTYNVRREVFFKKKKISLGFTISSLDPFGSPKRGTRMRMTKTTWKVASSGVEKNDMKKHSDLGVKNCKR